MYGVNNSGGGSGGAGTTGGAGHGDSFPAGHGIVVVRYAYAEPTPPTQGGIVAEPGNGYKYHTFTAPGVFTLGESKTLEVLIVGGGGGGRDGGGGGGTSQPPGYAPGGSGGGGRGGENNSDDSPEMYGVNNSGGGSGGAGTTGGAGHGDSFPAGHGIVVVRYAYAEPTTEMLVVARMVVEVVPVVLVELVSVRLTLMVELVVLDNNSLIILEH